MVADYYAMLGADPRADRAELEAALARRQPAWSSGTRNPKTKHTFQSYLDQIPEIRRVLLGDPAARAAYDAELAAAQRVERDRRLDELQRLIKLRAAKGGLGVADRTLLREQAERLGLASSDLDRLIEPIPPRPEPPADLEIAEPPPDVLDPVTRRQIRVALDHLARRDLYDALGIARDAPSAEVTARTDAERRRWMQKTQVTAEKTAWLEVVSHAQSHLIPPHAHARGRGSAGGGRRLRRPRPASARPGDAERVDRRGVGVGDRTRARRGLDRSRLPGAGGGPGCSSGLDPGFDRDSEISPLSKLYGRDGVRGGVGAGEAARMPALPGVAPVELSGVQAGSVGG